MDNRTQTEPLTMGPDIKQSFNIWLIVSIILFVALCGLSAYTYSLIQRPYSKNTYVTPTMSPTSIISPTITTIPSITTTPTGSVSGRLCYPSSFIPSGKIVAKNIQTAQELTQDYPGVDVAKTASYTLSLPEGVYHMKFEANPGTPISGYYTTYSSCVDSPNPDPALCNGQQSRPLSPVNVTSGGSVAHVNLCDFYYPPDNEPQF